VNEIMLLLLKVSIFCWISLFLHWSRNGESDRQ